MRRFALLGLLICGCAKTDHRADDSVVPLNEVPAAAIKAAQAELPGVKFDTAWKTEGGAFEIRGKTPQGKIRDVQVTASGEVVEVD